MVDRPTSWQAIANSAPKTAQYNIMRAMKEYATAANMPHAFISGIESELKQLPNKRSELTFFNNWRKTNKYGTVDLANIFENGSKSHDIVAHQNRPNPLLKFQVYGGEFFDVGSWVYAPKVRVRGIPALKPMAKGFELGIKRTKQILKEGARRWNKYHKSNIRTRFLKPKAKWSGDFFDTHPLTKIEGKWEYYFGGKR